MRRGGSITSASEVSATPISTKRYTVSGALTPAAWSMYSWPSSARHSRRATQGHASAG